MADEHPAIPGMPGHDPKKEEKHPEGGMGKFATWAIVIAIGAIIFLGYNLFYNRQHGLPQNFWNLAYPPYLHGAVGEISMGVKQAIGTGAEAPVATPPPAAKKDWDVGSNWWIIIVFFALATGTWAVSARRRRHERIVKEFSEHKDSFKNIDEKKEKVLKGIEKIDKKKGEIFGKIAEIAQELKAVAPANLTEFIAEKVQTIPTDKEIRHLIEYEQQTIALLKELLELEKEVAALIPKFKEKVASMGKFFHPHELPMFNQKIERCGQVHALISSSIRKHFKILQEEILDDTKLEEIINIKIGDRLIKRAEFIQGKAEHQIEEMKKHFHEEHKNFVELEKLVKEEKEVLNFIAINTKMKEKEKKQQGEQPQQQGHHENNRGNHGTADAATSGQGSGTAGSGSGANTTTPADTTSLIRQEEGGKTEDTI